MLSVINSKKNAFVFVQPVQHFEKDLVLNKEKERVLAVVPLLDANPLFEFCTGE